MSLIQTVSTSKTVVTWVVQVVFVLVQHRAAMMLNVTMDFATTPSALITYLKELLVPTIINVE